MLVCMIIAIHAGARGEEAMEAEKGGTGWSCRSPESLGCLWKSPCETQPKRPAGLVLPLPLEMKPESSISILILKLSRGTNEGRDLSSSIVKEEKTKTSGWVLEIPS